MAVLLLSSLAPAALAHGLVPRNGAMQPTGADALVPAPHGMDPSGLLPSLPWESANRVRVEPGTPWVPLVIDGKRVDASSGPVRGTVEFWCPGTGGAPSVNDGTNTMTLHEACPYRIIDDADLMGSPQIAVDADHPESMAFFSMHGAGTTEGATPRSRDPNPEGTETLTGLSHTTFTSQDHGIGWYDNPWGTDGFGEHVTGVMDRDGNLYIGALWSKRLGNGEFDYVIKTYKEQDSRFQISNYQPSKTFGRTGSDIAEANLVYLPAPLPPHNETLNATGNATGPATAGDVGNYTNGDVYGVNNTPDDRVLLVWHEKARDWRNSTTGKSSWIDAAWTDTTPRDNWTRLANGELVGPCMDASNPVAWRGKAYVACVADDGYAGRSRARIGDIDIWSIDPKTGKSEIVAHTGVQGGHPRLTSRLDGYMALTSTKVLSETEVEVQLAWGWYGSHWTDKMDIGSLLHGLASNTGTSSLPPGTPAPPPASNSVREARITAMAITQHLDTLFLVYMERINVGDVQDPNPSNPFISPDSAIEYKKIVATFTKCDGPTNVYDLQVGVARHPFAKSIVGEETGVFDDMQDGMQVWRDPSDGSERIYFAYGDHGVVQYGALVAGSSLPPGICPNPPPAPSLPVQVIPAGLSASSPYTTLIGSSVGLTATAMVGYLLAVKRKSANALAAKAKK